MPADDVIRGRVHALLSQVLWGVVDGRVRLCGRLVDGRSPTTVRMKAQCFPGRNRGCGRLGRFGWSIPGVDENQH